MTRRDLDPNPDTLRDLRQEAGLSQTVIAQMVHLSGPSRVSDWEKGKHPIDPARWELLLIKLGKHREYSHT